MMIGREGPMPDTILENVQFGISILYFRWYFWIVILFEGNLYSIWNKSGISKYFPHKIRFKSVSFKTLRGSLNKWNYTMGHETIICAKNAFWY